MFVLVLRGSSLLDSNDWNTLGMREAVTTNFTWGVGTAYKCVWRSANMASWKCGVYVVVGTIVIVLIILLNFDFLPKRRLSEELELTTKSSFKGSTTSKGIPSTLKVPTERTTSNLHSTVAKVRLLKFNAEFIYFSRKYTEIFFCMITEMFPILKTRFIIAQKCRHNASPLEVYPSSVGCLGIMI